MFLRAEHLLVHPGNTQAAFLEAPLVAPFFQFFRVDEFPAESRQKVPFLFGQFLVLGKRRTVHHDHPHGTAHLRGRQTHPVGRIHRLEHIVDERIQFRIVFVDLFGPFLENRFSVGHNRKFHIVFCLFCVFSLILSLIPPPSSLSLLLSIPAASSGKGSAALYRWRDSM